MIASRRLVAVLLLAALAACGGNDGPTARSIAEQACATMAEIADLAPDDVNQLEDIVADLGELDAQQEEADIPIEDIDAAMAEICPELGG